MKQPNNSKVPGVLFSLIFPILKCKFGANV